MSAKTPVVTAVPTTDGNQMWKVTLGNVRVYLTGNVEENSVEVDVYGPDNFYESVHVPCLEYKEPKE